MVPTSESCGRSTRAGFGAGGALASADTAAGGGGRRDIEKIGRSRVPDKVASGFAQSGLALAACGIAATGDGAGLTTTAGAAAAGKSWDDDPGRILASSGVSASRSDTSLGRAAVGAATTSEIVSKSASRMAGLRIMSAAVMSYRYHPQTAARMRRMPTPIRPKPRTDPSLSHTLYAGQRPNSVGACRVTKPF
jgi:hypothetical protein